MSVSALTARSCLIIVSRGLILSGSGSPHRHLLLRRELSRLTSVAFIAWGRVLLRGPDVMRRACAQKTSFFFILFSLFKALTLQRSITNLYNRQALTVYFRVVMMILLVTTIGILFSNTSANRSFVVFMLLKMPDKKRKYGNSYELIESPIHLFSPYS